MRRSRSAVAALALVATIVGPSTAHAPRAAAATVPAFGVTTHVMWGDYTEAERMRMLDELQAAGVRWVRIGLYWSQLEPAPGARARWVIERADRMVDAARDRGMRVLVGLGSTPGWAGSAGAMGPPDDPATYASIAGWAAGHFAGRVDAWGIYNQPNTHGWDPAVYAELLRRAYPAIKAGDPEALVVGGNVGTNDDEWIAGLYAAGAKGSFDVLATHAYQGPRDLPPEAPDIGVRWRISHVGAVRDVMLANEDEATPIWFTEFGWSSHPNDGTEEPWRRGVSLSEQADYAVRAYLYVAEHFPYVAAMFWYNDRDKALGDIQEDHYGLVERDLSPKPVYRALQRFFTSEGDVAGGGVELLGNGGFEAGLVGWTPRRARLSLTARAYEGAAAGLLHPSSRRSRLLTSPVALGEGSRRLVLTAVARGRREHVAGALQVVESRDGTVIGRATRRFSAGSHEWCDVPLITYRTSGEGGASVRVLLRVRGADPHRVVLDDVALVAI